MVGGALLAFLLFLPPLSGFLDSYFSFVILLVLLTLALLFLDSLIEFATSFLRVHGGFFDYISASYNRWLAYIVSVLLLLVSYFFTIFLLVRILSFFLPGKILVYSISAGFIILGNLFLLRFKRFSFLAISFSMLVPLLLFLSVMVISFIGLNLNFPLFQFSPLSWGFIGVYVFSMVIFIMFPYTLLLGELDHAEEVLPDHNRRLHSVFFYGVLIAGFLFSGLSMFTDFFTLFYSQVLNSGIFQIAFALSVVSLSLLYWASLPRLLYAFGIHCLTLPSLGTVDKRHQPKNAFFIQTILLLLFLALLYFITYIENTLLLWVSFIFVLSAIILVVGIFIMRIRLPDLERPFALKKYRVSTVVVALVAIISLVVFSLSELVVLDFIILAGIILFFTISYFLFENYFNESMYKFFNSVSANFTFMQVSRLGLFTSRNLVKYFGDLSNKRVLEFGAHAGFFTRKLISHMHNSGNLFATDPSRKCVSVLKRKFSSHSKNGIRFIFLKDYPSSIHPSVSKIDFFFSAGIFWHIQHVDLVLKQLNFIMNKDGRLLIMTPSRFLFFPLKWWSSDKTITEYFVTNGFRILISRHLCWYGEYIIIRAVREKNAKYLPSWYELKD